MKTSKQALKIDFSDSGADAYAVASGRSPGSRSVKSQIYGMGKGAVACAERSDGASAPPLVRLHGRPDGASMNTTGRNLLGSDHREDVDSWSNILDRDLCKVSSVMTDSSNPTVATVRKESNSHAKSAYMTQTMCRRSESRKMTKTIQVRSTPEEKNHLKARAAAFGISIGELVRQSVFRAIPNAKTDLEAIQALAFARADLGRLGGLYKGFLAGSFPSAPSADKEQIRKLLHEIEAAQNAVLDAVKKLAKLP